MIHEHVRFGYFFWCFGELVEQYLEWCEINHKGSYGSDKGYCANLVRHFKKDTPVHRIKSFDIERYKAKRIHAVKPATVNHEVKCLKHMFKMATTVWELTEHNPTNGIKTFREDNERLRFLTSVEREQLINACKDGPDYLRWIVLLATNTGMRRGEILNLEWKDVSLEKELIRIPKSKSGKPRDIPMNQVAIDVLKSIPNTEGKIFPIGEFRRSWNTALKRAGITNLRFHDLRHEFASQLVMSGADMKVVQEVLGHSSLRTTQRYAHISDEHKRNAVKKIASLYDNIETGNKPEREF